jgi:hypothetical protein
MSEPFLAFVSRLQRAQKTAQRESQDGTQLDLLVAEGETLACLIVLDIVRSIIEAGGALGTLKIQMAINAARERAITLLNSQFPHHADMRPRRNNSGETGK